MRTIIRRPLRHDLFTERLRQENARLRMLLRAVKRSVPLDLRERIEEELKDDIDQQFRKDE